MTALFSACDIVCFTASVAQFVTCLYMLCLKGGHAVQERIDK